MSALAAGDPAVKKKHVRFARMEDDDDDNDDQEEDTLFDKRKDTKRGLKSALKVGKRTTKTGFEGVEIIGDRGSTNGSGACSRWMVTLALCTSFLGLGMGISVLGPTFEDLAKNVHKNISNISYIFVGRSMGYIGGSLLGGILFDHMNSPLLLGISMLVTSFGMCGIPFCKKAILLTGLMSSIGVSMGVLDTGGNVLILNTWGDQAGPHMQALHFSFAAGAFASPIIAKMLFATDPVKNASGPTTQQTAMASPTTAPTGRLSPSLNFIHGSTLESMWAYIVIGGFILLASFLFFALYLGGTPTQNRARTPSGKPLIAKNHNALILLLFFFFFWYVGAEVAYGSFIFTYAKKYAGMDEAKAAGINSLFWGTFAAGRGLAIFFAACMHPGTMILLSLVGCTLSSLLLVLFSGELVALWGCSALYGVAMSTTFPSGISWVEQYTTVTSRSAATFVVGAALGEMVLPALVGFLMGRFPEQPLLMYLALVASTVTSIIFPVMFKLASSPSGPGKQPKVRGRPESDDSEYRQALLDSEANEDEEEQEDEVDQWNDADFEVIEMDDASLITSPNKTSSPPAATGSSKDVSAPGTEPSSGSAVSCSIPQLEESPRRKLLLSLDREKKD